MPRSRKLRLVFAGTSAWMWGASGPVFAQDGVSAGGRGDVSGTVMDTGRSPVEGAEVLFLDGRAIARRVRSDGGGRFALFGVGTGMGTLRVRRVGYRPWSGAVRVTGSTPAISVVLTEVAPMFEAVRVVGDEAADERLRGFYRRREAHHFGRFVTESEIDRAHVPRVSDLLRGMPGVMLLPSSRIGSLVRIRGCRPMLWVDGVRVPSAEVDETTSPPDVAAIEVYNSSAGVPAQFLDRSTNGCGTILVWTRLH